MCKRVKYWVKISDKCGWIYQMGISHEELATLSGYVWRQYPSTVPVDGHIIFLRTWLLSTYFGLQAYWTLIFMSWILHWKEFWELDIFSTEPHNEILNCQCLLRWKGCIILWVLLKQHHHRWLALKFLCTTLKSTLTSKMPLKARNDHAYALEEPFHLWKTVVDCSTSGLDWRRRLPEDVPMMFRAAFLKS